MDIITIILLMIAAVWIYHIYDDMLKQQQKTYRDLAELRLRFERHLTPDELEKDIADSRAAETEFEY